MSDLRAVAWKERRSMFRGKGTRSRLILTLLSPLFIAVYLPWSIGIDWFTEFPSLLVAVPVPVILMGLLVPDSFAGERERHTLATLMASRLSERSIMAGKILIAGSVAWGLSVLALIVGAVVVNITQWDEGIHFYRPSVIITDLLVSLLITVLTGALGVLISLRTQTVQESSQLLMGAIMLPVMLMGFLVVTLMKSSDRSEKIVMDAIHWVSSPLGVALVAMVLLGITGLLWWIALRRFSRSRLLFD